MTARTVLGIDLGGAAAQNRSAGTTGCALLIGDGHSDRPQVHGPFRPQRAKTPAQAEYALMAIVREHAPDVVAIDAPLTLPPCLSCSKACPGGPGEHCELRSAREMWEEGKNPTAQRACETVLRTLVEQANPRTTMRLGPIVGRAIPLVRRLSNQLGYDVSVEARQVLEIYPAVTLLRLGFPKPPPQSSPAKERVSFRRKVLESLGDRILGLDQHPQLSEDGHAFDALIAAYTGWLCPDDLEAPPEAFDLAAGWIWFPKAA